MSKFNADYKYDCKKNGCIITAKKCKMSLNYYLDGDYNATNATQAYAVLYDIINDKKLINKAFKSLPKIDGRYNVFKTDHYG